VSARTFWLCGWLTVVGVGAGSTVAGLLITDITGALSVIRFGVCGWVFIVLLNHGWHVSLEKTRRRRG
jgi:hypothetical protein